MGVPYTMGVPQKDGCLKIPSRNGWSLGVPRFQETARNISKNIASTHIPRLGIALSKGQESKSKEVMNFCHLDSFTASKVGGVLVNPTELREVRGRWRWWSDDSGNFWQPKKHPTLELDPEGGPVDPWNPYICAWPESIPQKGRLRRLLFPRQFLATTNAVRAGVKGSSWQWLNI